VEDFLRGWLDQAVEKHLAIGDRRGLGDLGEDFESLKDPQPKGRADGRGESHVVQGKIFVRNGVGKVG